MAPLWSPERVAELMADRRLRLQANPAAMRLQQYLLRPTASKSLQRHFDVLVKQAIAEAEQRPDAFREHEPLPGEVEVPKRPVPLLMTPTGTLLQQGVKAFCENTAIVGSTGSGKTSYLRGLAFSLANNGACVLQLCRKGGEFAEGTNSFVFSKAPFFLLRAADVPISFFTAPTGTSAQAWTSEVSGILARAFGLQHSQRLLTHVLDGLAAAHHEQGFTLRDVLVALQKRKPRPMSREAGFIEALLFAIETVVRELGPSSDVTKTDFLERLQETVGCMVVDVSELSAPVTVFVVTLWIQYIWRLRRAGLGASHELIVVLDDAIGLTRSSKFKDADEGSIIADLSLIARSVGIGCIFVSQAYGALSPTIRANTATTVVCSAEGPDAREVAEGLNLTREQAAELPLLRPGTAIVRARSVWPHALRGRFPEVK